MTRMAWTAEDRRKYVPVIQEVLRQGMIVRLVRTMDALDAAQGRPRAGVVDPEHAPGLVAPGPRRLRLTAAAGRVPALHHRVGPAPPLARAGRARPRLGDPRRLPPPRARPQAAADGGDRRHPERQDRPAAGPA